MAVPRFLDSLRGAATEAGGALLGRLQHVRLPGLGQSSVSEDPETAARRWRAVTVLCSAIRQAGRRCPRCSIRATTGRLPIRPPRRLARPP